MTLLLANPRGCHCNHRLCKSLRVRILDQFPRPSSSLCIPARESVEGEVDEAVEDGLGGRRRRLGEPRRRRLELDGRPPEGGVAVGGDVVGQQQVREGLK